MIVLLTMIMVAYGAGCIAEEGLQHPAEKQEMDDTLLELAAQEPEVGSFIAENRDYQYEITVLYPENITQMSKKYPVIYGNLPNKTLYRIDYKNGRGMLLIVDLENGEVLKHFRTAGVSVE